MYYENAYKILLNIHFSMLCNVLKCIILITNCILELLQKKKTIMLFKCIKVCDLKKKKNFYISVYCFSKTAKPKLWM